MEGYSSRALFSQLSRDFYPSYVAFEQEVRDLFASHVESFPPDYSPGLLLELAERKQWIAPEGIGVRITFR